MDSEKYYDMKMTVPWGDCDAAGISYYAKSFEWFTDAYMQMLDDYGFPYMETLHNNGIALVCLKADCEYKKMIRPLERITVRVNLTTFTRTRLGFTYQVLKENGELAAHGFTSHAFVNQEGLPFNLKKHLPLLWEQLANGFAGVNGDD